MADEKLVQDKPQDDNLFHSKRFIIRFVSIAMGVIILICGFLYIHETSVKEIDIQGIKTLTEEQGVRYQIDNISCQMNYLNYFEIQMDGWCAIAGKPTDVAAIRVLLKDTSSQKVYKLPTTMTTRTEATSVLDDGNNYDNSGFSVHIMAHKIKRNGEKYQILLLYDIDGEEVIINTNQYLK